MNTSESAIRSRAKRNGYVVRKSRRNIDLDNFGKYMLIDASTTQIVMGSRFDANLREINQFLAECRLVRSLRACSTDLETPLLLDILGISNPEVFKASGLHPSLSTGLDVVRDQRARQSRRLNRVRGRSR